jgi:hypothetical protein
VTSTFTPNTLSPEAAKQRQCPDSRLQYIGSSFCPSVIVMLVPAVLKFLTYRMRYRWSAQKWQAGTGDCSP